MNEQRIQILKDRTERLNSVSPTFCLAKWKQSTTTLYNGMTHSCHHPSQHKINIEDIKNNPAGLHNTPIKFVARADMLKGIQTKECDYCWNIENLGKNHFSDRHYKSAMTTGVWEAFDEVIESGLGENISPAYFEVAFENICNFKCSYCSPDVSSRWMEEIDQHGPYHLSYQHNGLDYLKNTGRFPIHYKEDNPYINAFWEWWPTLYQSLSTFRITGGEPLLSKNTWKVIDYIIDNPRDELVFSINTNLCVPRKLIDEMIVKLNSLDGKLRGLSVFTSAESTGAQAEYSRYGMNWDEFTNNVEHTLLNTADGIRLVFMTTVNVFSISTFDKFLLWISELRKRFNKDRADSRVGFSVSYLRWPEFLCLTQLDDEQKNAFEKSMLDVIDKIQNGPEMGKMYLEEIDQIHQLINFTKSQASSSVLRSNFAKFVDEYDKRRGTNFSATFPELQQMYQGIK